MEKSYLGLLLLTALRIIRISPKSPSLVSKRRNTLTKYPPLRRKIPRKNPLTTNPSPSPPAETDRVYSSPATQVLTIDENKKARYEITRDMLGDVVVWNPWEHKASSMADFGPEGAWRKMVCVEAGSVGEWNKLEAGDTWEGGQRIRVL